LSEKAGEGMENVNRVGQPVTQWMLTDHGPMDEQVHIQIGIVESEHYVDHTGFGQQRYADQQAASDAVRRLQGHHRGTWQRTSCDEAPFDALRPANGARVLYDTDGNCLWGHWGDLQGERWDEYQDAMNAGHTFRRTETHALLGGVIEVVAYRDPGTGVERYAVLNALEEGADFLVVDYPDRVTAESAYERAVNAERSDALPFRSSDRPSIVVDRASTKPAGMVQLDDGGWMIEEDYEELYGPEPSTISWPRTPPLTNPDRVRAMTSGPRDWAPELPRLSDVTLREWVVQNASSTSSDLALLTLADGRQLLASAHDDAAHVWNVRANSPVLTVAGHSERVLSVALVSLADGRVVLATGGLDGYAKVWDAEGKLARELTMVGRTPVNAVAWVCPPGKVPWLVTGGDDATVRVWDPERGRVVAELELGEPRADVVWSVAAAVLADGHVCVAAGANLDSDLTVHIWDVTANTTLHRFVIDGTHPHTAAVSVDVATVVDGSFRVAGAAGSVVHVWDGRTGDVVRKLELPDARESVVALAALPDLRVAVAAAGKGETVLWDTESGAQLASVTHQTTRWLNAVDLAISPDGDMLLAVGDDKSVPARLKRLAIAENDR
jgi:WD40 repeat protein